MRQRRSTRFRRQIRVILVLAVSGRHAADCAPSLFACAVQVTAQDDGQAAADERAARWLRCSQTCICSVSLRFHGRKGRRLWFWHATCQISPQCLATRNDCVNGLIEPGQVVSFTIGDAVCPEADQVVPQIGPDLAVTGEVIYLSDRGDQKDHFAVISVEGIHALLIVPIGRLCDQRAAIGSAASVSR